jgi:hypothetical protein
MRTREKAELAVAVLLGHELKGHFYPGAQDEFEFTSDCAHGCGAWMGSTRSGAPEGIDPFGRCPKATERFQLKFTLPKPDASLSKHWSFVGKLAEATGRGDTSNAMVFFSAVAERVSRMDAVEEGVDWSWAAMLVVVEHAEQVCKWCRADNHSSCDRGDLKTCSCTCPFFRKVTH